MQILSVYIFLCLSIITYQDFKFRAVSWILFPALAISGVVYFYMNVSDFYYLLKNITLNILFIIIQLSVLWLVFFVKEKRLVHLTNEKLGWGDILFLVAAGCFFTFPFFLLFNILSLAFSLIGYLLFRKRIDALSIPLAGLQSIFLAGCIAFLNVYNINRITSLLYG